MTGSKALDAGRCSPELAALVHEGVGVLRGGGVIAYPTEFCFGLGCDPLNEAAVVRLLAIKRRNRAQGVILIAADKAQIEQYGDLSAVPQQQDVLASWPGPVTWLLPAQQQVPEWIRGHHSSVAMRIPGHSLSQQLCRQFGHAIVSTSANRHGQPALLSAEAVRSELGEELDFIVNAPVGGATAASTIRDAMTGETLR